MTFEYSYGVYNPGQYPADTKVAWDAMVADGWQVNTAAPAYNEIYILWEREIPEPVPVVQEVAEPASRDRDSLGRFQPAEQTSGELQSHEGQDAR